MNLEKIKKEINLLLEESTEQESKNIIQDLYKHLKEWDCTIESKNIKSTINVLCIEPGKYPKPIQINNSANDFRNIVGGEYKFLYFDDELDEDAVIILNTKAQTHNMGLAYNRSLVKNHAMLSDIIVGPFLIVRLDTHGCASLTSEQMNKYQKRFAHPQIFVNTTPYDLATFEVIETTKELSDELLFEPDILKGC